MTASRCLLPWLAMIVLLLAGACESTPRNGVKLNLAIAEYDAGRFDRAHERAVEAMRGVSGSERERAAYIAGLSAFELGDTSEAELRLVTAARSDDRRIAGSAKAMLGQIRLDQRRYREAASHFDDAAAALSGQDGREANRLAAISRQLANDPERAAHTEWLTVRSSDAASVPGSGFVLQVGAFREHQRAARAAHEARQIAERDGLSPVNVVSTTDQRGRTLYLVQLGHFDTRHQAAEVRSRIGRLDFIVTPANRSIGG